MATGLIALLDDVAAIAKLAAASLDDVAAQTAKAGVKAAGVVIDDTAVTPAYVVGLSPARELPIIGRIALGSLRNKLVFLLPAALALSYFAPWIVTPLLMVGGVYLCYEGAEKLHEALSTHGSDESGSTTLAGLDPASIENEKVAGAVRTDFILSAEIMALTLANVAESNVYTQAAVLAAVGVLITFAVYGVVALIVKADDVGLVLAQSSTAIVRGIGKGLVLGVPPFLKVLGAVGTAAMLWVGGSIIVHGLSEVGYHSPEVLIESVAEIVPDRASAITATARWFLTTASQAVVGVLIGAITVLVLKTVRR